MKDGFAIGGVLIVIGLILQVNIGVVDWSVFHFPVNGIVLGIFLLLLLTMFCLRRSVDTFQFLGSYGVAVPAMALAVILTIIMGLTRQTTDGLWLNSMLTFWPFVLIYLYVAVSLGLVVFKQSSRLFSSFRSRTLIPSLLFHLGLFIALTTATLGSADRQTLKLMTMEGVDEWRALDGKQRVVELPFSVELQKFIMETYDDGMPKRYASEIKIHPKKGQIVQTTVDVNKPVEVDGWHIYQYDYQTSGGTIGEISIFQLVYDPWLPVVYTGFFLMLVGALCLFLFSLPLAGCVDYICKHRRQTVLFCVLLTVVFVCIHHFMPILHAKKLVPALQSPWFVPHIIAYMIAYTLMGVAAIMAVYRLLTHVKLGVEDTLVYIGIAFITVGMLFGAFWAKEAWGHYWEWDPKETWAAITWLSYLVYIHWRIYRPQRLRPALWMLLVCFVLLQMCWWGIRFLPSAQGASVHVY